MKTVEVEDIWKLLYKHVQNHYPSLKQAFLEIDAVSYCFINHSQLTDLFSSAILYVILWICSLV